MFKYEVQEIGTQIQIYLIANPILFTVINLEFKLFTQGQMKLELELK